MTDTSEHALESHIVNWLVERNYYEQGSNNDYNREYAIDETRLLRFLTDTQKEQLEISGILESEQKKHKFFARIQSEIFNRGIVDVLRNGVKFLSSSFVMFYLTPSGYNTKAIDLHGRNIFSVTRQLHYSPTKTRESVDMCIFINGLPVITIELKNHLTGQTADDAVTQYMKRDYRETLFSFKHCIVHFAADDMNVKFCTRLAGTESEFLPFDKGYENGAGNPPNPEGYMTDYLWKDILTKEKLTLIIENYACVLKVKDKVIQIFPRYHQLDAVTKIIADVRKNGVGQRYLIQHSAGSGKSNSIAWLAYQLAELEEDGRMVFASVFVVTDKKILDKQIRDTVNAFKQVSTSVIWAAHSDILKAAIEAGKRIIITTVEKFPYISKTISGKHTGRNFAVIIDEAHSSQGGDYTAKMNRTLSGLNDGEDTINHHMEGRKMLKNASYFAFTATPKNKTLEIFGTPYYDGDETKHRPFHVYTMKQAIQEGFILDVLQYYTPVKSYFSIIKTADEDPTFNKKQAMRRLASFVEHDSYTIAMKAAMMVEHFHEKVIARGKIGGQARAMIVTADIHSCIDYYYAVNKCLAERESPYKAIIAFSGVSNYDGKELTSKGLNGFNDSNIPQEFRKGDYRFLIVADMFQTGFDEPLLHTMYVDKTLTDIKAVQTLSRLNRPYKGKNDTFILDFANDAGIIERAFSRYYRTVILSGETDPDKLHDIEAAIMACNMFTLNDAEEFVSCYIGEAEDDEINSRLDRFVAVYRKLDEESQRKFKKSAKDFVRTYNFLGAILPYTNAEWEKLCIFLTLLLPKLQSVKGDDFSGLYESVDIESYRIEAEKMMSLILADEDSEIQPVQIAESAETQKEEEDLLSVIVSEFNIKFGTSYGNSSDSIRTQIERIAEFISEDKKYQNAVKNSDEQGIRFVLERVLPYAINKLIEDSVEFYKHFQSYASFKNFMLEAVLKSVRNERMKQHKI